MAYEPTELNTRTGRYNKIYWSRPLRRYIVEVVDENGHDIAEQGFHYDYEAIEYAKTLKE